MTNIDTIEQGKVLSGLLEEEPKKRSLLRSSWETFKIAYILGITGFACFETVKRRSAEHGEARTREAYEAHLERCRMGEAPKSWTDIPGFSAKMYQKMCGMEGEAVELKVEKDGKVSFRSP